jgi:hypothetical protein
MGASKTARAKAKRREKRHARRRRDEIAAILGMDRAGTAPPPGLPKMSDVLVAFAAPILDTLDEDPPLEEYRGVLRFASIIWNVLAMFDEEGRRSGGVLVDHDKVAELTNLLEQAVGGFDEENLALLDLLRARRAELFPDERRIFMDVGAELQGNRVQVVAASTFL